MSSGRNDLEIVISRVDDICKFLNNFKKNNRNTIERINKLEQQYENLLENYKAIEDKNGDDRLCRLESDKKEENIVQRLEHLETNSVKINEQIYLINEAHVKQTDQKSKTEISDTRKNGLNANSDFESLVKYIQSENVNLQKGIHDLDEQISNLDEQYKSIKETIELQKSKLDEKDHKMSKIESNIEAMRGKLFQRKEREECSDVKCRQCDESFATYREFTQHTRNLHRRESECKECHKKFATSSLLEQHMLDDHGTVLKYLCKECGKGFHFRWRLNSHMKMHNSEIRDKIRKCHFFNNKKECPFQVIGCKFRHEEAANCKYRDQCKFEKCQFRH